MDKHKTFNLGWIGKKTSLNDLLKEFKKDNPEWETILLTIIQNGISALKTSIEHPTEKEITWDKPWIIVRYPAELDWGGIDTWIKELKPLGDGLAGEISLSLRRPRATGLAILADLSKHVTLLVDGDKLTYVLPPEFTVKLEGLPEKKKQALIRRQINKSKRSIGFSFHGTAEDKKTGKIRNHKGTLRLAFGQLEILITDRTAYYPIYVGLAIRGHKPTRWTERDKETLWISLLEGIKTAETVAVPPLPTPTVKLVIPGTALIKASLHTERQKFGQKPTPAQRSLFDLLDVEDKKKAVDYGIEQVIGIDLTHAQSQALFAIQKLLEETNYKGNLPAEKLDGLNRFRFWGELPSLKFLPAQYLEAYGVKKYETSRGKYEFSGEERKDALRALIDLAKKPHFFVYKRHSWEKNKKGQDEERIDRIETIDTLIKITQGWEALTKQEDRILDSGKTTQAIDNKLKAIAISPAPILVDQIDHYFVPKPANYRQEIRLLVSHASKYVYDFIDFLLAEVAQREIASKGKRNQNWVIEKSLESWAHTLRMNSWIETRNWKQIRGSLKKCYETAKELGYLTGYEMDIAGKTTALDRLTLNPEKFKRMRKIEEERKQFETKLTSPPP